jgi:glycerophosphoryl diester phosphodiesterase
MSKPLNIAHRGGADLWPENTLAAFAGAIACGADGAELDVHLTRDGEIAVYHDEALKPELTRAPDGSFLDRPGPLIRSMSFDGLQAYDVGRLKPGSDYAARHPRQEPRDGERIPRLRDVIRLAKERSRTFSLWIELKTDLMRPARGSDPDALAESAVALVREERFEARTVFVSFDWRALKRAKSMAPEIPIYATTLPLTWFSQADPPAGHGPPPKKQLEALRAVMRGGAPWEAGEGLFKHGSFPKAAAALGADGWFPYWPDLTPSSVEEARALGLRLAAWTVPADRFAGIAALGLDALCTDDPAALAALA